MAEINYTERVKADGGGYDTLYPKTTAGQVIGLKEAAAPAAVTQAEAENGTGAEVRGWSPQRVAQAVRACALAALSVTANAAITATDTVLGALGKLQAQITALKTSIDPGAYQSSCVKLGFNAGKTSDILQHQGDHTWGVVIGAEAGRNNTLGGTGACSVLVGMGAGNGCSAQYCVAIGMYALGMSGENYINNVVAVGYNAGKGLGPGNAGSVYIGNGAGMKTQGNQNTFVGSKSNGGLDYQNAAAKNCINCSALGYGAENIISGNNQIQLGNSATTTYTYGAVQNRSDRRDKTDIRDTELGLEFINDLCPVDFRWDLREDYHDAGYDEETGEPYDIQGVPDGSRKRGRYHHGLIAQDVKATLDKLGVDFGGYQDHSVNGGLDRMTIGYTELIGPMIKAIQELSEKVDRLEGRLNADN